jgi:hypothetical protein
MAAADAPGPGVDAAGRPVIDPTQNVLDLVEAAIKRQDDLREMDARHVREIITIRADYDQKLREAESERIDAIRAVDVGAVQRATEVASVVAETLRTQVATTASAAATGLSAALEPIIKDIADLRRAQYEAQGVKAQTVESTTKQQFSTGNLLALAGLAVVALIGVINIAMNMR